VLDATTPTVPLVVGGQLVDRALRRGQTLPARRRTPQAARGSRWFGAKGRKITSAKVADWVELPLTHYWTPQEEMPTPEPARLAFVRVEYADGDPETYELPLAFVPGTAGLRMADENHPGALLKIGSAAGPLGVVVDAHHLPGYGRALARFMHAGASPR